MKTTNILPLAILALLPAVSSAAVVAMSGSDGFNATSFNLGTSWTGGAAPTSGNDYITGNNTLRTPPNANAHDFAGDSLTVNNTTAYPNGLFYKGTGTSASTGTITINNLMLNGGIISHGQGDAQFFNLAGNITVGANSTIWAKQGPTNIYSAISGNSAITIPIPDGDLSARVLTFHSTTSTFTGNLINNGRFVLADNAVFNFSIGASGVNNSISGTGSQTNFNGIFIFDFSAASIGLGDSWTIATIGTFGSTFSVAGFSDNLDNTWSKDIGGGLSYNFNEGTRQLSVIPEPSATLLGGLGPLALLRRRRAN